MGLMGLMGLIGLIGPIGHEILRKDKRSYRNEKSVPVTPL
jgi:hypothetical protein